MRSAPKSDPWWKNAVIYCLDVETFYDADGDGCGDLTELIERVDHAARLGASCLWLMPFCPTPNRDDGYDITDYLAVPPPWRSRRRRRCDTPRARSGLRVIVDLVVNHTSDERPWFRAARADRTSRYRDYYVWSDDPAAERGTRRRTGPGTRRPTSTTCTDSPGRQRA
jgi:glycosidase